MNAPLPLAESALAAHDLSYTINGAPLLSHVSLCIRKGENLGIVGPNGSGKSTLIRLLAGLQTPTAGRVWLNGERLLPDTPTPLVDGAVLRLGDSLFLYRLEPAGVEDAAVDGLVGV